ncbi:MAG: ankyrin repeat domain-containing protein [Anaeroplasma sp.]
MNAFDSIFSNNINALKEYLETGDVNIRNERGMSLLHYAIIFNNSDMFELLLDNYINVDIQDNYGDTPTHLCVINNRIGFLKSLIRHNANLSIKNNDGHSPLFKACSLGREAMVYLLLESTNFNLYETDSKDETVFMALIRSRNLDLLNKLLLDDKIIDCKNCFGEAPLHIASKTGDIKIVNYLLNNNAFVNIKNNSKETPLFYAVRAHNLDVIDILLKNGAVLDCKSTFGDTVYNLIPTYDMSSYINEKSEQYKSYLYHSNYPLHYSIIIENYELVKKYCEIRNVNRMDAFGYTPLDLAIKVGNDRITSIIKDTLKDKKSI